VKSNNASLQGLRGAPCERMNVGSDVIRERIAIVRAASRVVAAANAAPVILCVDREMPPGHEGRENTEGKNDIGMHLVQISQLV